MENSIEEDIKILEEFKTNGYSILLMKYGDRIKTNFKLSKAIEHILSDYKKLQEESKQVDHECERLEEKEVRLIKENEELKRDRNNNYQMIALAQNEALGYMQGYEDGKKLKRSAVACIVENQQYYIIKKEIEHYKKYIEKLQKENEKYKRLSEMNLKNAEEFKNNMCEHRCLLKSKNEELKKFITEGITVAPHSPYKNYRLDFLRENFVSKKKIKDKIEELNSRIEKYREYVKQGIETDVEWVDNAADRETVKVLQELLESEDSKDGENKKSTNTIRNSRT